MAGAADVRRIAMALPRTTEHLVRDHTKYRIGRIVYASVSPDEERLGFGFPKEERAALVTSEPGKFMMPAKSDERYNWVRARLAVLDNAELRELLIDAWCMCVSKKTAAAYLESLGVTDGLRRRPPAHRAQRALHRGLPQGLVGDAQPDHVPLVRLPRLGDR